MHTVFQAIERSIFRSEKTGVLTDIHTCHFLCPVHSCVKRKGSGMSKAVQHFCAAATGLEPDYVSMVIPSRWFAGGRENLLGDFRKDMLGGGRVRCLHAFASSRDLFPTVEIKGGVCYYLEIKDRKGPCQYYLHRDGEMLPYPKRKLDNFDKVVLPMAVKYGIKAVLDLHVPPGGRDPSGDMNMFYEVKYADHFVKTWRRIAHRFRGREGLYGYDLSNEPSQRLASAPIP